ncbi:embryonic protein DC-8-like [Forsythia ovata]|uniref:Embryonic protein DC-8-like n=1 Tax=Forsythia ovata TaxID=205694 RepID=A0ABD1U5G3_9LAMI
MEELKLKEEGVQDVAKQRAAADWETAADRQVFQFCMSIVTLYNFLKYFLVFFLNEFVKLESQVTFAGFNRGMAARSTIYGAMGSLKDAIKDKLTYPSDIVQEARAVHEYGGPKRGEKTVDDAAGTPSGPAAAPTTKTFD